MRFCYVKSLYFRYISKIKKFRTKNPGLGSFLYGIHRFWTIYTKLTFHLQCNIIHLFPFEKNPPF